MNKREYADIVVVGGGAIGTAVTCYLARSGMDVALVERGEVPWGSSKRCDGHAVTYDSPPGYFSRFCKMGLDLFPTVIPELPCDIQFEPEGIGLLVDDEKDLDTLQQTLEGKRSEGMHVELWDQDELRRREPHVAPDIVACLNFWGDAKLNPMRLAFGLSQLAAAHGAHIYTHTLARAVLKDKEAVCGVETDTGVIRCRRVVLCAGVWTPVIAHTAGVDVPIRPRQGHILVTERVRGLVGKNYAEFGYLAAKGGQKRSGVSREMEQFGVAMVLEPTSDGTVLCGSSRRFAGMDMTPHPAVMRAQAQRILHFFPKFSDVRLIRAYAGLRPATPDGKPIISPTGVEGLYVAAGHEGNGIGLSLVTGHVVAQMLKGETPDFDLDHFRLDRFYQ